MNTYRSPNQGEGIRFNSLNTRRTIPRLGLLTALCIITIGLLTWTGPQFAQAAGPPVVTATATLSILAGTVRHISAGDTQSLLAKDGMNVNVGDRIVTEAKATALVTFLDGSTLTVQPDSDVEVKRADVSEEGSRISIKINLGTVWARVVKLVDAHSSFSLESNTAAATVHDGLIGGRQTPDHSFICWTMAGDLMVTDRVGKHLVTLLPGEKTKVQDDKDSGRQPFAVHQSTLRVTASPNVLPLLLMDDQVRVAGFVAPALEVNQVFGSLTKVEGFATRMIEVPAGVPGPFTLRLEGKADTEFLVTVEGFYQGTRVYRRFLTGSISKGEQQFTHLTHELESSIPSNPKTAKLLSAKVEDLKSFDPALPGDILASPMESKRLRGM